ncbi:MAG: insulinase family protein [Acidobacteria bacterium]|nr:insulinase family protein [Acidobacteriota bacterium]
MTKLILPVMLTGVMALAQSLPPGVQKVTTVEGITEYRLENGLRVLLFPEPSKTTATVNITYLVGSRHENYGETGMAHLLEHLVFKGSPRHTNIPKELSDHGARPNGTTWYDRTNYFESFKATEENLRWALDLESDRMVNSFIAKKDLDSEMTVVRNEFEMGENSPFNVLMERVASTAYLWHNYGKTTIGARADIENVSIERLQAFYRKYYQPDNAVLTIAGKIDERQTLGLVVEYFGKIPKPTRVIDPTYTKEPTQDGERTVVVRRVGDQKLVMVQYHVPPGAHADNAALNLLSNVLGNTPAGRLHKALVETKKATSTSSMMFDLREPGMLIQVIRLRKDGDEQGARDIAVQTIEGFAAKPVTAEEVDRARRDLMKGFDLTLNDTERIGMVLSESIAGGDWRLLFWQRDRIESASIEDVQKAALRYLKPSNRTVGLYIPEDKPDRAEIDAVADPSSVVKDYKGRQAVSQGEAFDPAPSNIDRRTERGTLPGGLKYSLLPKKNRGEKVNLVLSLRLGDEKTLFGKSYVAGATGSLLDKGTSRLTRQQIRDEFDKLKAQASVGGGTTSASIRIETVRASLPAAFRVAAEVIKDPVFPQKEFDEWRQRALAGAEARRREPQSVASVEFSRHMEPHPKGDVRYQATPDEDVAGLQAVTLDEVKQFYKSFYGASAGELTIVGDFDAAEMKKLAGEVFGNWKSAARYTRILTPFKPIEAKSQKFETPDKANAALLAGFPIRITDEDPDYPALVIGSYIFGGGFLNSRLAARIRGKEGLSYGVGGSVQVRPKEDSSRFIAYAIAAPQNIEKVEAAMREELQKALESGFTEEEVSAAKKGWLQQQQVSRAQDGELAQTLGILTHLGRTMEFTRGVEARIDSLTAAEVNAAFKKHMGPGQWSVVKAGDFAKK